jgi:hypothetical protein
MSDEESYTPANVTLMGPEGPYRIRSYKYVAIVSWYEMVGCGAMWDMRDEKHEEVVAKCDTYEDAIEAALPFCREKTVDMQTHGFDKSTHAVIKVKDECEIEYIKENEHEGEE